MVVGALPYLGLGSNRDTRCHLHCLDTGAPSIEATPKMISYSRYIRDKVGTWFICIGFSILSNETREEAIRLFGEAGRRGII